MLDGVLMPSWQAEGGQPSAPLPRGRTRAEVENARRSLRDHAAKRPLPLGEREIAEVPALEPEEVERHEARLCTAKEQRVELRPAVHSEAGELAVEDRIGLDGAPELLGDQVEALERVPVPRDQSRVPPGDVREGAEPIVL